MDSRNDEVAHEPTELVAAVEQHADVGEADTPETGSGLSRSLKATLVFTFAGTLPKVLSFLLLPLMTRAVTPAEYGQVSVGVAVTAVTAILLGFSLDVAVVRNYFQLEDAPRRRDNYLRSVWLFVIGFGLICGLAISAVGALALRGSDVLSPLNFSLAVFTGSFAAAAQVVPFAVLRAAQRLKDYLVLALGSGLLTVVGTLLAVVVLNGGVTAWLFSTFIASVLSFAIALWVMPFRWPDAFSRVDVVAALKFSFPMLPHYVSHWALQLADRFVLAALVTTSALGVYSLAANLAFPVMVVVQSLGTALWPAYSRAGKEDGAGTESLRDVVALQAISVVLVVFAAAMLAGPAIHLLTPDEYADAANLAGWLIVGYGFLGLYFIPIAMATLTLGNTEKIWHTTAVAALLNLGITWLLVPEYGLIAAAGAAAVGYATLFLGITRYAYRRGARVSVDWLSVGGAFALCIAAYAVTANSNSGDTISDLVIRLAVLVVTSVLVAAATPQLRHRIQHRLGR